MNGPGYYSEHWTAAVARTDHAKQPPQLVTVNDRAATREAIIKTLRAKGIEFHERSAWGAHKIAHTKASFDWRYTKLAIHHAGRSAKCGNGPEQVHAIQDFHQRSRLWADIGYHYAVDCQGGICEGRDIRYKGGHLENFNSGAIGIVLLNNMSEPEDGGDKVALVLKAVKMVGLLAPPAIPSMQIEALKTLIEVLQKFFCIDQLGGHSDFPNQNSLEAKLCPGRHGLSLVRDLRAWSGLSAP